MHTGNQCETGTGVEPINKQLIGRADFAANMAAMWWWRKVRRADIPKEDRDEFERYGETVVALLVASELTDQPDEHASIVVGGFMLKKHIVNADAAAAWLTERADLAERREDRLETVEWAVLIFVAAGVIADVLLVLQHIGSPGH